jgi:acetyl esterase/lipase
MILLIYIVVCQLILKGRKIVSEQGLLVRKMMRESNMWNTPLEQIREMMASIEPAGIPERVLVERITVGTVPCERFCYQGEKSERIGIYYHGGGGCLGIFPPNREFVARLCEHMKMDLFMPDYRLAPEHRYPAAHEDSLQVYQMLVADGRKEIVVIGDSFGCMLALDTVQKISDEGSVIPTKIAMITPFLDVTGKKRADSRVAAEDPFQMQDSLRLVKVYLGDPILEAEKISTIYGNLKCLPPLMIHAAEYDVFSVDAQLMYERAVQAGVSVKLKNWDEMWHTFHMQDTFVPEAVTAVEELCAFLTER